MFDKSFKMCYYVQAIRSAGRRSVKKFLKIFQKSFKNNEKMLDLRDKLVVIYTSCPRESG